MLLKPGNFGNPCNLNRRCHKNVIVPTDSVASRTCSWLRGLRFMVEKDAREWQRLRFATECSEIFSPNDDTRNALPVPLQGKSSALSQERVDGAQTAPTLSFPNASRRDGA
jgi:hypothetical protein